MDGERFKEWREDGFDLTATMVPDYDADTSHLGSYYEDSNEQSSGDSDDVHLVPAVEIRSGYLFSRRGSRSCYYRPQAGCEDEWRRDEERLRDYYAEGWYMVGVVVTVSRAGIKLAQTSLWGIESDCGDYMEDVAKELSGEAIEEAKKTIDRLRDPE